MPDVWVPIIVGSMFIVVSGGVILLRPVTKRLGSYLEMLIEEKRAQQSADREGVRLALTEELEERLSRMEQRLDFAERLLSSPRGRAEGGVEATGGSEVERRD